MKKVLTLQIVTEVLKLRIGREHCREIANLGEKKRDE